MMYLSGFPGFQDQGNRGLFLSYNQMSVQGRYRQQGRDRHVILIHASVREDHNIHPISVGTVDFNEQSVNCALQTRIFIIGNGDHFYLKAICLHALDLHQIRVGKDRIVNRKHITVLRNFLQNIAVCTNINRCGGYNLLTDGINRRIGNLGK